MVKEIHKDARELETFMTQKDCNQSPAYKCEG